MLTFPTSFDPARDTRFKGASREQARHRSIAATTRPTRRSRVQVDARVELSFLGCASVQECPPSGHQHHVSARRLSSYLPRRFRARVASPEEMRMGSSQYGSLILDGKAISRPVSIEARSLLWSDDGKHLAAQELVAWRHGPTTRVVVFDTERKTEIASSPPRNGIGN